MIFPTVVFHIYKSVLISCVALFLLHMLVSESVVILKQCFYRRPCEGIFICSINNMCFNESISYIFLQDLFPIKLCGLTFNYSTIL